MFLAKNANRPHDRRNGTLVPEAKYTYPESTIYNVYLQQETEVKSLKPQFFHNPDGTEGEQLTSGEAQTSASASQWEDQAQPASESKRRKQVKQKPNANKWGSTDFNIEKTVGGSSTTDV